MTKTDVYNSDYTTLNHCYIEIYNSYRKLLEVDDADFDVMEALRQILVVFNPTLDRIKSQMTVKTRFKDSGKSGGQSSKQQTVRVEKNKNGAVILHGNFTGE